MIDLQIKLYSFEESAQNTFLEDLQCHSP